ncbi:hypothetical protein F53441_12730 [Fusarium austroafricanum]|uniref:NmrA-like domain-containing protein n=1 Tax=Fusarium austroafricanum TaxID=2364996 RepID=A0A8H4JXE1_9HYPO|nr:hypothetical protein F53441_12730 [Fusarium austroafricanum]
MSTKTIAVVGATGTQGGSAVKAFAALPNWHVKAITRRSTSPKAQALQALGAEVIEANLSDAESLTKAFEGAHAIFVNTDFWAPYTAALAEGKDNATSQQIGYDTEALHVKNAAIAASKTPTLEKYIYSALGPMKEVSKGKFSHCHHFEAKAIAVKFIENEMPELAKKTSYIYMAAYATNAFLYPKKDVETGEYLLTVPASENLRLPILDIEGSAGSFVRALVEDEPVRTKLLAYDDDLTILEIMDAWMRVTGKKATFQSMTEDEMHKKTGLPYEILDGPAYLDEHWYCEGVEGVITPKQLKKPVKTDSWEEYLKKQDMEVLLSYKLSLPDAPSKE